MSLDGPSYISCQVHHRRRATWHLGRERSHRVLSWMRTFRIPAITHRPANGRIYGDHGVNPPTGYLAWRIGPPDQSKRASEEGFGIGGPSSPKRECPGIRTADLLTSYTCKFILPV